MTQQRLSTSFGALHERGIHLVRWWVFPGEPWQIQRDEEGLPTGVIDSVYADFDAALALAEKYDLYFVFTLFSAATALPDDWRQDPAARERLGEALRPLFERYAGNDRVFTWQVFNEPEWEIHQRVVALEPTRETVRAIAEVVHESSNAYVSVGSAKLSDAGLWRGLGLDYYTAHWYDPMTGSACAICTNFEAVRQREGLDAPLVIGEHFAANDDAAVERLRELYDRGYAGAWAWSLLPAATNDKMAIDLDAMQQFAADRVDVGPAAPN